MNIGKNLLATVAATVALSGVTGVASGATISCNDGTRTWTLGDASACGTGPGNPNASADITALGGPFAGSAWTKRGDVTGNGDASSLLDFTLTSGAWDSEPVAGNWSLSAGFWTLYGEAVITSHVGGNPGQPPADFAAFVVTPGTLSGTFAYDQTGRGGGGGLSNLSIWTRGAGRVVPEPATLGLLGLGLLGAGVARRRRA